MIYTYYGIVTALFVFLCIVNYFVSNNVKQVVIISIFSLAACFIWTYSFTGLTGHPRDASMNFLYENSESRYIKDFFIYKKESIYLWVVDKESIKSYKFPWSKELAKALFEMKYKEKRTGKKANVDVNKLAGDIKEGSGDGTGKGDGKGDLAKSGSSTSNEKTGDELDKEFMDRILNSFQSVDEQYEIKE